jgi:hypothetical protein
VSECRVCVHPKRAEIDAVLRGVPSAHAGWLAVRPLVAEDDRAFRPGGVSVDNHYKHGHHFGRDDAPDAPLTDEMVAAKARRLLNDKLDSLPAKDLKDLVLQNMKTAEAREKTKQLLAGKRKDDDPQKDAVDAAARALGHHKARLAVVGNDRP